MESILQKNQKIPQRIVFVVVISLPKKSDPNFVSFFKDGF